MLRNLLRRSPPNRLIAGTPQIGIIASTIIAETATGDNGAGLLYDDALAQPGRQLRVKITSWTGTPGTLTVHENGSILVAGQADGTWTIGYDWEAWAADGNLNSGSDTTTLQIGPLNATAPGAALSGAGTIVSGDAIGGGSGDATAPGTQLTGAAQIVPGVADGQQNATAPGAVLIGGGSLQPGAASGDLDGTAPGATLVGGGQFIPGNASDGTSDPVFRLAVSIEKRTRLGLSAGRVTAYLWQEIILENVYLKGEVARLHCRVADSAGRDIDPPTLSLMMRYGAGVTSELVYGIDTEIVRAGQGRYYADVPLTERGTMHYRWETGALDTGAAEASIVVRGGRF